MIKIDDQKLLEALKEYKVEEKKLNQLIADAKDREISLYKIIKETHLLNDGDFGRLSAKLLGLPFADIAQMVIPEEILRLVPEKFALDHNIVTFNKDIEKGLIYVATNNPSKLDVIRDIEKKTQLKAVVHYTTARQIKDILEQYSTELKKLFLSMIPDELQKIADQEKEIGREELDNLEEEFSIIDLFEAIMLHAFRQKASDIHLEARKKNIILRYRIDGVLHEIVRFPKVLHSLLLTRCKILANLRIDESRAAQDGRIKANLDNEEVAFRVSILPTHYGEKAVMRLLRDIQDSVSLEEGGIAPDDYEKILEASKQSYGMLLITGPTGSGKTTTLYSILKILNEPEVNISTIEDPIEYGITGVNQTQVNASANLTFATGLRSLLRQDPDVILVGEIRDEETAQIAIESAMTGHLVLSTLHANTSAIAIPRLIEMGMEPFLLASAINVIVAQRLVRKLCECKQSKIYTPEMLQTTESVNLIEMLDKQIAKHPEIKKEESGYTIYEPIGCMKCGNTGYRGRNGIYEILAIDTDVRKAILTGESAIKIEEIARKAGMNTLLEDGLFKVLKGNTSLTEVLRVLKS